MINANGVLDLFQAPLPKRWSTGESQKSVAERAKPESGNPKEREGFGEVLAGRMDGAKRPSQKSGSKPLSAEEKPTAEAKSALPPDAYLQSDMASFFQIAPQEDGGGGEAAQAAIELESQSAAERNEALLKFMDSMESDFGIRPQRFLRAMASLNKDDLMAPPEDSAAKVIQQLHLTKPQEKAAMELYLDVLSRTSDSESNHLPSGSSSSEPMDLGGKIGDLSSLLSVMRRADIDRDVTSLGARFFDVRKQARGEHGKSLAQLANSWAGINDNQIPGENDVPIESMQDALASINGLAAELPQAEAPGRNWSELTNGVTADPSTEGVETAVAKAQAATQPARSETQAVGGPLLGAAHLAASRPAGSLAKPSDLSEVITPLRQGLKSYQQVGASAANDSKILSPATDEGLLEDDGQAEMSEGGEDLASRLLSLSQDGRPTNPGSVHSSLFAESKSAQANLQTENLNEIVQQSQILVRKGGGEMKIELKPEGMGQLNLKVAVDEGKVKIDIMTESPEVRRQIEGSLADLRTSLEHHKLHVDQVRINVADHMMDDLGRDQTDQQQRQAQQELAREFLGDFRDFNRSRQDELFSVPGLKGYRQAKRKTPEPIQVAGSGRSGNRQGGSLNLVA